MCPRSGQGPCRMSCKWSMNGGPCPLWEGFEVPCVILHSVSCAELSVCSGGAYQKSVGLLPAWARPPSPQPGGSETTQVYREVPMSPKERTAASSMDSLGIWRSSDLDRLTEDVPGPAGVCPSERRTGQLHVGPFHTARVPWRTEKGGEAEWDWVVMEMRRLGKFLLKRSDSRENKEVASWDAWIKSVPGKERTRDKFPEARQAWLIPGARLILTG